jgi:hypothetical protein
MRSVRRFVHPLALVLCASTLLGQNASQDSSQTATQTAPATAPQSAPEIAPTAKALKRPAPTGILTGTVTCADTRLPARGAVLAITRLPTSDDAIELLGSDNAMTRTGLDGTFTVHGVEPGEYAVIPVLPGYLSAPDGDLGTFAQDRRNRDPEKARKALSHFNIASIHAGSATTLNITMQRGAAISGRVLYSDGSPATQITMDLEDVKAEPVGKSSQQLTTNNLGMSFLAQQSMGTDDQGHYRISGIRAGSYRVAAIQAVSSNSDFSSANFGGILAGASNHAAVHVYAGDTPRKKDANVYELHAGEQIPGIDITLPLDAFHKVHGSLSARDGRAINAATLTLADTSDDTLTFRIQPSQDGSFIFPNVPVGTYSLKATDPRITVLKETSDGEINRYSPRHTTNAFADSSLSVIVKDEDVYDINFYLDEVPVPPDADKKNNPYPNNDDDD